MGTTSKSLIVLLSLSFSLYANSSVAETDDSMDLVGFDVQYEAEQLAQMRSVYRDITHIISKKSTQLASLACQGMLVQKWFKAIGTEPDGKIDRQWKMVNNAERKDWWNRVTELIQSKDTAITNFKGYISDPLTKFFERNPQFNPPANLSLANASEHLQGLSNAFNACATDNELVAASVRLSGVHSKKPFNLKSPDGQIRSQTIDPSQLESLLRQGYDLAN